MRLQDKNLICPDIFAGKRVLVIGLGKTGLACVHFLYMRGVEVAVMDSRLSPPALQQLKESCPDVAVFLGEFDKAIIESSDVLVVSPGISIRTDVIKAAANQGKQIIGDIEIFARCNTRPVIAITGSNGKSTVTTLVGEMARLARKNVRVGGNIGTPALELLLDSNEVNLFVLELSSFQLETTVSLDAVASVVLNISEDHMDRYDSLDDYVSAKAKIFQGQGVVVANMDDPVVMSMAKDLPADRKVCYFTLGESSSDNVYGINTHNNELYLAKGKQLLLPVSAIRISGKHNIANVLAALALGTAVDLSLPAMLEAIQTFTGLAHRTQWVAEHDGVSWFNDSKATNVGAAIAAIQGLGDRKLIVLMGGQGKGQDFTPLRDVLKKNARQVILFGEDASLIENVLAGVIPVARVENLSQAVLKAKQEAKPGDAVLLSPACASFDMFNGFEDRGNRFMQMVMEVTQ